MVSILIVRDIGDGLAAADETVIGVEFDQQIEFVVDLLVDLFQRRNVALARADTANAPPAA